jgi:hypothetical protein
MKRILIAGLLVLAGCSVAMEAHYPWAKPSTVGIEAQKPFPTPPPAATPPATPSPTPKPSVETVCISDSTGVDAVPCPSPTVEAIR